MGGLRRRLERLEAEAPGVLRWEDWPLQDQLEAAHDALEVHRIGGTRYAATDRETHLVGLLCALWELPGGVGEYRFPSGAVVSWSEGADGKQAVAPSSRVRVEDLPEDVRGHWGRMDPERQPDRERWLYEGRHRIEERRYWKRYHSEEQTRARHEESKQRSRDLLERNRAACGLPPLTPEQIERDGLEGTTWEAGKGA